MIRRRLSVLGAAVAAALVLAGCSTSAPSESQPSTSAAASSLQEIKDAGVITVGTEGTYRPFSFHEGGNGELTGYDVEIVKAVAQKLGVDVKFEETQWDAIFAGLDAGRFDVIANQVSINEQRQAKY
ncbi:MAG TPA: transporter substrate-binding domain-containing protein, partial [Arthrobacter sp.]|nr:transporter substrate-binding domain-containing protein [Arthrobacter sp.]